MLFFCYSQTYNTLEKKLDDQKEDIQELTEQLEEVKEKLERRQETQKAATADNPSRRERKWCDDEHVRSIQSYSSNWEVDNSFTDLSGT